MNPNILEINSREECHRIEAFLRDELYSRYKRDGIVVGLSGGIDSAVMAALAARAVGSNNVFGLILPERESSPDSKKFAVMHGESLGIRMEEVDISDTVDSVGGYSQRDDYIKKLIPQFEPGYPYNIVLPTDLMDRNVFSFYRLQVKLPDGEIISHRLKADQFRTLTAFASIKIRARMIHLYWAAERNNCIVCGTTNRTEMILGDFCKYGDGGTDTEALSHLYKNQIYQLGEFLDVIPEIIDRTPSPDTFSLPVSDEEFFFRIPFEILDHLLYAWERGISVEQTAESFDVPADSVKRVFRDFDSKSRSTSHLREMPHEMSLSN